MIGNALKGLLRKTALPSIPSGRDPTSNALKENIEVLTGKRGSPLDRAVTLRDLVDAKVINYSHMGTLIEGSVQGDQNIGTGSRTPPSAITSLAATGGLGVVFLTWDQPAYTNYAYTELWRSATDDLGTAVKIGTAITSVYADTVGDGDTYYYWARAVTTSDVSGPFNAVSGIVGKPAHDPGYVMNLLTVKWAASHAYALGEYVIPTPSAETGLWYKCTVAGTSSTTEPTWPVTIGQTVVDNGVTWQAIAAGSEVPPFVVGEISGSPAVAINGDLFVDGTIVGRMISAGEVTADKITTSNLAAISANLGAIVAGSLNINNKFIVDQAGNATLINASLSANYVLGASGWALLPDGTAEFNSGTFRGTLQTDEVYDTTYSIPGVFVKQLKYFVGTNRGTVTIPLVNDVAGGILNCKINYIDRGIVIPRMKECPGYASISIWNLGLDTGVWNLYFSLSNLKDFILNRDDIDLYISLFINSTESQGWDGL